MRLHRKSPRLPGAQRGQSARISISISIPVRVLLNASVGLPDSDWLGDNTASNINIILSMRGHRESHKSHKNKSQGG